VETVCTQFDLPEMLRTYAAHENHEIIDRANRSGICFVFFSSHGIYYPNTAEAFHHSIVENNRFEWRRNLPHHAQRIILLRDVTKQWYLEGINSTINSVDRLLDFLREKTEGMEVVCVGSSAGGYAATLFGCLLNASHAFNFSGQHCLDFYLLGEGHRAINPTLVKFEDSPEHRRYYRVHDHVAASGVPIFHFYAAKCEGDVVHSRAVEGLEAVHSFRFDSGHHADTCMMQNYTYLFAEDRERLKGLHAKLQGRLLTPREFSVELCGLPLTLRFRLVARMKRTLRSIRRRTRQLRPVASHALPVSAQEPVGS
jgi:hypothetical protein